MGRASSDGEHTVSDIERLPFIEVAPDGGVLVWVCNRCGQPLPAGSLCNSAIHVGPDAPPNGEAVTTESLIAELTAACLALAHASQGETDWVQFAKDTLDPDPSALRARLDDLFQ